MSAEEQKKPITIYAEASPNPDSMKFVANVTFLPSGISADYPTKTDAEKSPLSQAIFDFDFVERVFISSNFISITKASATQWVEVIPELRGFIKSYLEDGKKVFTEMPEKKKVENVEGKTSDSTELEAKIIELLDNYVRPAVEGDGGNIDFVSFKEGIVTVRLQGSCSGCPSATVTLKSGIESLLKRMVPEVTSVEAEGIQEMF